MRTMNKDKELLDACQEKKYSKATELLQQGANPNVKDSWFNSGRTPLHYGCEYGNLEFVKLLIEEYDVDTTIRDDWIIKKTPLHYACVHGHVDIVQYFIRQDCNVDKVIDDEGNTPLHIACFSGKVGVVKVIINEAKCNPDLTNRRGDTALHIALENEHLHVLKVLISEEKCNLNVANRRGETVLHLACKEGLLEIVKVLISDGKFDPSLQSTFGGTALHLASENGHKDIVKVLISEGKFDPDLRKTFGNTALHLASQKGHIDVARVLIREGNCSLDLHGSYGYTALHFACKEGHRDMVKYLIREVKCNVDLSGTYGDTALHLSCDKGHLTMVNILVNEGNCNPDLGNTSGNTALHIACVRGHLDVVKFLVFEAKCKTYMANDRGNTPLHVACKTGHSVIVKFLIFEAKCKTDMANDRGNTPLHIACKMGHSVTVKFLINQGQWLDLANENGNTVLHLACEKGHLDVVKVIISEGKCNPDLTNNEGKSAFQIAFEKGQLLDLVKVLVSEKERNPDLTSKYGCAALLLACEKGQLDIVKVLISERKYHPDMTNEYGNTGLHLACEEGYLDIAKFLISEGKCNPDLTNNDGKSAFHFALEKGHLLELVKDLISERMCNPNLTSKYGYTALLLACEKGQLDIVKVLINEGNYPSDLANEFGDTGLHLACKRGHLYVVTFLISKGKYNPDLTNKDGNTCVHLAGDNGHVHEMRFLICETKYNTCLKNNEGDTALHVACNRGYLDIVRFLIKEEKCNPDLANIYGNTALHLASEKEHLDVVKVLIAETKCNPDQTNRNGDTPLHLAAYRGHLDVVRALIIQAKCNPDLNNESGNTVLHLVGNAAHLHVGFAKSISLGVVSALIGPGKCNPNLRDKDGNTPLHLVCQSGRVDLANILLEAGKCDPNIKNKSGASPSELTSDPEMLRVLIRHGANPENVYTAFGKLGGVEQPIPSPVKIFVVGDPSAGKSTLTAALQREPTFFQWLTALPFAKRVSGVDEKTAGVIPQDFESKTYGKITFFDFAGHREFYSSHAALLQNAIQSSPPIFLLVVDISRSDDDIKQTVLYWLSFLKNQCGSVSNKPHVIVVGSHADVLLSRDENPYLKAELVDSLLKCSQFYFSGFVPIDCQYYDSTSMNELRKCLQKSCDELRIEKTINFNTHCFFVYLLANFDGLVAVQLHQIQASIKDSGGSAQEARLLDFLPRSLEHLHSLCEELNDRGHILYLKNATCVENSWVILDKVALLSEVTGNIFAPEGFDKLASSTGVVPLHKIRKQFPYHDINMLIGFLSNLEFCHEVSDPEILEMLQESSQSLNENSPDERHFFFPGLVTQNVPSEVWKNKLNITYRYQCGWVLQCSQSDDFFTSQFLQVLLLRLAFNFAFPHDVQSASADHPAIQRKCSIWRNGIYWGNRDGVETLVEVPAVEHNKSVIILMRSEEVTPASLQLRSGVIQKVLEAAKQLCQGVTTYESFIARNEPGMVIHYPLTTPTSQLTTISLKEIAESIVSGKPSVLTSSGHPLSLTNLMSFEPYADLGELILNKLFSAHKSNKKVDDQLLSEIAEQNPTITEFFKKNPRNISAEPPLSEVLTVLKTWRDSSEGTYQCLREMLDQFSIFGGRNPLELAGVSTHTESDTEDNVDEATDQRDDMHDLEQGVLSINALPKVQRAVWDARVQWYNIGLYLGIPPATLDVIEKDNHYKTNDCFKAMLKEWLQTNPSWSDLVEALECPTVDFPHLAREVKETYVDTTTSLSDF